MDPFFKNLKIQAKDSILQTTKYDLGQCLVIQPSYQISEVHLPIYLVQRPCAYVIQEKKLDQQIHVNSYIY